MAQLLRGLRRRAVAAVALIALPLVVALALAADLLLGRAFAYGAGIALVLAAVVVAILRARAFDETLLVRRLNAVAPVLEDSADLVSDAHTGSRTRLQQLQALRVRERLARATLPDLRAPLPGRWIAGAWIGAGLIVLAAFAVPALVARLTSTATEFAPPPDAGQTTLREGALTIVPPAYTGQRETTISSLDGKAPAGSHIAWTIRLDRDVTAAALVFHDGTRLPLRAEGDAWRGERAIESSILYRLALEGAPPLADDRLHRIDAVPDAAPELIVRAPEKTLTIVGASQRDWTLDFEARDDYGLGSAQLSVTLARGSGEQIEVSEQTLPIEGRGDAHERRYRHALDLGALAFAAGDDVIVRLSVADNRAPEANVATSPSLILRWEPESAEEGSGVEGLVAKAMPAYFRSQRQIIIDTEALIAERAQLDAQAFADRSDVLGVDQRILRRRYGQFLGEEAEEGAGEAEHDEPPVGFGAQENVVEEYGHVHDEAEAATLFDPETRRILKAALDEMWQAELHLRTAKPDEALPYEYKALEYIKQVQQAERIYLARTGLKLPQVDETRRLSGKREGLEDRTLAVPLEDVAGSPVPSAWKMLASGRDADLARLESWVRRNPDEATDSLGLLAAIDALRRSPDCVACRGELEARLWPLLPKPATSVIPRAPAGAAERAWLEALAGGAP
jgi:hypothetical protein